MRILVAPDKFKDSLGAAEVAEQIAAGLQNELLKAEIRLLPIADGGEGTASIICAATEGEWQSCEVRAPLGDLVWARYCAIANGATAVMEMSQASGLWRVPTKLRDPLAANSFGTGQMLLAAAARGASEIIIGLGGSATNDGGFGMARALGFAFFDENKVELTGAVSDLLRLAQIKAPEGLRLPRITVAADVRNPLLGPRGATRVFGRQKGASAEQLDLLEEALTRLADVVARDHGFDHRAAEGAGAAGGLGFGLLSFCSAEVRSGFEVVAEAIGLEAAVRRADVVITGEGRLDAQTLEGKAPAGVAQLARKHGKKIYAIVGSIDGEEDVRALFDGILMLVHADHSVEEAIANAAELLRLRGRELGDRLVGR